jgi:MinD-like ATPase involved in chromosome partitioning or flagellar assembly
MALANTAMLLSLWGYRVLMVDWDLEAPGLEYFFKDFLDMKLVAQKTGVIDLLSQISQGSQGSHYEEDEALIETEVDWNDSLVKIDLAGGQTTLHLLTAGSRSDDYFRHLRNLDLHTLYEAGGGVAIERLRNEWKEAYDFVLVDSRTGITDIGGICTIQLPDILVLLFMATEQSLQGVIDVAKKASRSRWNLPFDRMSLISLPIAGKFDSGEEFQISQEWLNRFASTLKGIYENWLPTAVSVRDFLEVTKIPYIPYFSFGEKLPVLEQGTLDPAGLGYAYENLAALIAHRLDSATQLLSNRTDFVRAVSKPIATATLSRIRAQATAPESPRPLRVFLSYAAEDRAAVRELYEQLRDEGFQPWMDETDLLPGQSWEREIRKAIQNSDVVLFCLSHHTTRKAGMRLYKEIEIAQYILKEQPEGTLFLIPVRLEECRIPAILQMYQEVSLFEEGGYDLLLRALRVRAEQVGATLPTPSPLNTHSPASQTPHQTPSEE